MNKVKFKITATPILIQKVGQLMAICDLGIDSLTSPETFLISWETPTKVDKKYLKKMEKQLKLYYESEGCEVDEITHIK